MDLHKEYTQPQSTSFYQSPLGLYTSLKEQYGAEKAPTLKKVKDFLNTQKSHYLHTQRSANRRKVKKGESARWIIRSSIGILHVDCAYLNR